MLDIAWLMKFLNFNTHSSKIEKLRNASLKDETSTASSIFQLIKIFANIILKIAFLRKIDEMG